MTTRIAYLWRLARTAFGFALFGVAAPILAGIALPLARWRSASSRESQLRMQRAAHHGCRVYLRVLERIGILHLEGIRTGRLRDPGSHLVVANHPTLLDVVVLLAFMPQADCIVNRQRARNWLLRGMVNACGYLSNDGGAAVVEAASARIRAGRSLIIFPEGTRSPLGGLHAFRRGAAHIALRTGCDLLPVAIRCTPPTLGKHQKWYDVPDRAFTVTVTVIDPISPTPVAEGGVGPPLAARRLTRQLHEALAKGLDIVDAGST